MTESIKKLLRLAAIDTSEGPLHVLWTLDEDGVAGGRRGSINTAGR
jgi:hypothetical protein